MSDLSTGLFTLGGALIGGAASYLGGLKAVRWEANSAAEVARRIRREERREEGLLTLSAKLAEVYPAVDKAYHSVDTAPSLAPWPGFYAVAQELRVMWQTSLAGKIADPDIVSRYTQFAFEAGCCVSSPNPPPGAGADQAREFVKALGRTLMYLSELKIAVEDAVKRLGIPD